MSLEEKLLNKMNPGEPYTAIELADMVEESQPTVNKTLKQLAESGRLVRKEHSDRVITYRQPK
ncbi:hypothetical protein [Halorussus sp. AFM4]|uniref:hypothetical protein n=1 Tax=Halorussus sp. AFM4 TaxID=3421651 RepID=UPI003EBA3913